MAGFVLVGPPLAACLLRRLTRHVASDVPYIKQKLRPGRPPNGKRASDGASRYSGEGDFPGGSEPHPASDPAPVARRAGNARMVSWIHAKTTADL
jgi:hypothetical protein